VSVYQSLRQTWRGAIDGRCDIVTSTLLAVSEVLLINDASCKILQNLNAATTSIHRLRQGIADDLWGN